MQVASPQRLRPSALTRLVGIGLALALLAAVCAVPTTGVLLVAPALVPLAILLLGFAPGARLLERLCERRWARRTERAPRKLAIRVAVVVRRMASPAASALAMRPPPLPAAAIG